MIGQTLSHYRIVEKLGAGGMGEVYTAEDTKLSRKVALKVLPPEMAENAERRARFEREARAVAALDHANIVTIHSVEEAEGVHFYTMQLVKGKTLTELIPKNGMSLSKFFEIAIPLADAVSAAHEQGIVHRDLKPDNLMVSDEGRLKILDFGLAKLKPEAAEEGASELPTQSATAEGRILGTVAYMSPEQAEGKQIDHRSDIFSIGIILYEMATGERPFKGDTAASLLSSILKDKPQSATEVNPALPRELGKIIRRCLVKDIEHRYQTAKDVRNELEELKREVESGEVMGGTFTVEPSSGKKWTLAAAFVAVAVVAAVGTYLLTWPTREDSDARVLKSTSSKLTSQAGMESYPSLSPDGDFIAYESMASGNWDIYRQRVGGQKAFNLTEECKEDDFEPAFSPDGAQIAFQSERDGGGIFVMGATGESVRRLTDFGYSPSWSPDGKTILVDTIGAYGPTDPRSVLSGDIWRVDVAGGKKELLCKGQARHPTWSPNGHRIAFWAWSEGSGQVDIWTMSADGLAATPITNDTYIDCWPAWSSNGEHIFFTSNRGGSGNVWRIPIDEETGKTLGEPEAVTTGTGAEPAHISVSRDGRRVAYTTYSSTTNIQKVSFDPIVGKIHGEPVWVTSTGGLHPDVSPDGEWIAFDYGFGAPGSVDLAVVRSDGSGWRRLTESAYRNRYPRWSPDGKRLAFGSNRSGSYEIWVVNADGSGLQQITDMPDKTVTGPFWSPNGTRIAFNIRGDSAAAIIEINKPRSEQTPQMLPRIREDGAKFFPWSWSPDGRYLAGVTYRKTDQDEITLFSLESKTFRLLGVDGEYPLWLNDSRKLLFSVPKGALHMLDIASGDVREVLSNDILGLAPTERIAQTIGISPDDRTIFFARVRDEADIWMLTLNEERE